MTPAADTPRPPAAGPAIEHLTVTTCTIPTDAPEADGTLEWHSTDIVVVEAAAAGRVGIGWTYAPGAATAALISDLLEPVVRSRPAFDVPGSAAAMAHAVRNASRSGLLGYAIAAVDCALWDLKARLLDVSLASLLGRVRDEVAVYGSGGFISYSDQQLRDQLTGWTRQLSLPRVKIKIGHGGGDDDAADQHWIHLARDIIGPDVALFVDANGAYSAKQAIRAMHEAADADVSWFEEPVPSQQVEGLRQVRAAVDADVAGGEYLTDLLSCRHLCAADALDCLQVDVSRCGGITAWMRLAAVAAAHGLEVSGHCAPHLTAPVAAATENFRHLEWFHDHTRIEDLLFDGTLDPTGGDIRPDIDAPGNGLSLRRDVVEQLRTG